MSAKVGADAAEYGKAVPGCHFLTLAEAKTAYKKTRRAGLDLRLHGDRQQVQHG